MFKYEIIIITLGGLMPIMSVRAHNQTEARVIAKDLGVTQPFTAWRLYHA